MDLVNDFLTNQLQFPDWKAVLDINCEEFLKKFVRKHVFNVYFHNLGLVIKDPENRSVPTHDKIIENGFNGGGGLCNQLNLFAKHILEAIGFQTVVAGAGTWAQSPVPGTHCMIVVELDVERKYLVDVASGNPIWHPIPLHQLPVQYRAGGYDYEFRLAPDGVTYQKVQLGGSLIKGDFKDHTEELRYSFQLKSVTLKDIKPAMAFIYENPDHYLQKQPFIFRHIESEDSADEFILFGGKTVVKGQRA